MSVSNPSTPGVGGTQVEYGPDSGGRLKGMTIVKPVVVGNVAKYFGKKREEDGHTHQWTVYLKPYLNEDYSVFIKKVHFKLHDSYANPNRVITKPPYEVQETGWGEFEVVIKVYFNDPVERPVTLYHILKLFQNSSSGAGGGDTAAVPVKKNVVSETYDEIVFLEPTALMKSLLDSVTPLSAGVWKHEVDFEEKKRSTTAALEESRKKVKDEISDLRDKLNLARETIDKFKNAMAESQRAQQLQLSQPLGSGSLSPRKSGSFSAGSGEPIASTSKGITIKQEVEPPPVDASSCG